MGRPRYSPVGVSVTAGTVRVVQLERRAQAWAVREAIELPRLKPGDVFDPAEAARLAGVWRRRRFVGRDVVLALPNHELIRGLVEVKPDGDEPLLAAAVETERLNGLSPGTYELAAWQPGQGDEVRRVAVMVNGCRHETAEQWVELFASVGLNLTRIDSRSSATAEVASSASSIGVALDIGPDAAELLLLRGGSTIYQRSLPEAGLEHARRRLIDAGLDEELAVHLLSEVGLGREGRRDPGASGALARAALDGYAKQVLREAEPALDYAARVYAPQPIETLTLVGDGAQVPGLEDDLAERLGLGAVPVRCGDVLGLPGQGGYAVPLGLCLAGVAGGMNLLPEAVLQGRRQRRAAAWSLSAAAGYAAALVLGVFLYLGASRPPTPAVAADVRMAQAEADVATLEQSLTEARSASADTARRLAGSRVLSERPDWSTLLRLTAQSAGPSVVLDELRLATTGPTIEAGATVTLIGAAEDPWAVSTFVLSLEQLDVFDRVNITRSQRGPRGPRTVTLFTLECVMAGGDGEGAS